MKIIKLAFVGSLAAGAMYGCGAIKDAESDLAETKASISEFASFDLTCSFEDLIGDSEVETNDELSLNTWLTTTASSSICEQAAEQFSILVDEYDEDGDGVLSDEEISTAQEEFEIAVKAALDADGDGAISSSEKTSWRETALPARVEERKTRFNEACGKLGKKESDCKGLRDTRKEEYKDDLRGRFNEFDADKNGTLSPQEISAMKASVKAERDDKRKESRIEKGIDADGDGQLNEQEREKEREDRKNKQATKG